MRYILVATLCAVMTLGWAAPSSAQKMVREAGSAASSVTMEDVPAAGIGIRLIDIPTATQTDPRARSYIVDRLAPGAEIQRRVEVQNNTGAAQSVQMYSGSAQITDGVFVGDSAPSSNALSTWTTVDTPQVDLSAGGRATVLVTISVPSDASEGESYAAVWAEVKGAPKDGSSVVSASRAGVRIYLSVGPGNGAAADFTVDSLTSARDTEGNPAVSTRVTNTGGRALDITGTLDLTDGPAGLAAGPFAVDQTVTIAPGESRDILMNLDSSLPDGPWTASLTLVSGLLERTATATLTFPEAGTGETVAPDSGMPIAWIIVITVIAVLLVLALAAGTVWFLRRRRNLRGTQAPELRKEQHRLK